MTPRAQRLGLVWLLAVGGVPFGAAIAQPSADTVLPRRIQFGASLGPVSDSLRAAGAPAGARVLAVLPGSPAANAHVESNDIVVRIGRDTVTSVATALAALHPLVANAHVGLRVIRQGVMRDLSFVARERPRESSDAFDIVYTAVAAPGGTRRVLVTHPHGSEHHPTVILIGGIGCYSVDQASGENSYRDLMYHLTRRGYTTVRVEKAGVGDSDGGPCLSTDAYTELAGYRAALAASRRYPWVDPDRIFLFGHSIGGIEGPLLTGSDSGQHAPLRGIAVLSTVGIGWYEYELANLRRQLRLQTLPPDSIERVMALKVRCGFHFLVERQSREALLAAEPECAPRIAYPASDAFMQQVAALDPAVTWKGVNIPTLVMYGTSDFITSRDEHLEIVERVNAVHPGLATYADVPELDHFLSHQASPQASITDATPGGNRRYDGTNLEPILDAWLDRLSRDTT